MREYNAESPKQGRKRINSIVETIHFSYLPIIYLCPPHSTALRKGNMDFSWAQTVPNHRWRIKSEEKAKVVASVWREECIQVLAALVVLRWAIWIIGRIATGWFERNKWINHILQNRPKQNSYSSKKLNKFFPPNRSDDLCLFFFLYPPSMTNCFSLM